MKFGTLRAIGHNIADSLGSGIGLLVGIYGSDVYGEARTHQDRQIVVDFLKGEVLNGSVSQSLGAAVAAYREGLNDLCKKHGTSPEAFSELKACYSEDRFGVRVVVTVADHLGCRASDEYVGLPARRVKVLDARGRVRTV